jgi:hypothetical protein
VPEAPTTVRPDFTCTTLQADTFETTPVLSGFVEVMDRLEERAASFDGDVLLLQGDTHGYLVDPTVRRRSQPHPYRGRGRHRRRVAAPHHRPRAEDLFTWERIER